MHAIVLRTDDRGDRYLHSNAFFTIIRQELACWQPKQTPKKTRSYALSSTDTSIYHHMVSCFRGTIDPFNTYLPIKKLPESPKNWPVGSQNKPQKKRAAMLCPRPTPSVTIA
jgi:hypothetical protein